MIIQKYGAGYMAKYGNLVVACDLSRVACLVKALKRLSFKGYIRNV